MTSESGQPNVPPAAGPVSARIATGAAAPATSVKDSITIRLAIGFAVAALGVALLVGIIALRVSSEAGIPPEVAGRLSDQLLAWGFGAVLLAALVGAMVAKSVGEPIRRLAAELRGGKRQVAQVGDYPGDFAEARELREAIGAMAEAEAAHRAELGASETKFREAFELVGIGLTQVDRDGRFAMVNAHFCQMLGYSREELIGKRFIDVTHPDDRELDETLVQQILSGTDAPIARVKRYLRKDGSIIWANRTGVTVRGPAGEFLYAFGSVEDVTASRRTQEELQKLNESLRAVVETAPLAIYALTLDSNVTLWNPAAEALFGISRDAVIGRRSPLGSGRYEAQMIPLRERVARGEVLRNQELVWQGDGGRTLDLSISLAPLRNPQQEIEGIVVLCADVTQGKRTARELDQQLHFTQELLEVIPTPIFYRSAAGPYLGFNRAWEQFFNRRREDLIGKSLEDWLAPDEVAAARAEDEEAFRSGKARTVEAVVTDGRGERRNILRHVSRFTDADGKPAGVIGVVSDITDFQQVSRALEASEVRFKVLTESAMDIVTVLDEGGFIRYQSPSVEHLLGYKPQDMLGKNQFDLVHRDDAPLLRAEFQRLVDTGKMDLHAEFRVRNAAGEWRVLESIGKNCLGIPEVRGIIVNTRDITDRKAIQERVQHLAYHDALTGLPNRLLMQDRIAQAISRAERGNARCAVMFIDIDNFKNINDTLGHDAGDVLLREVAQRLLQSVRAHDTIARQGGDEFIILLDQLEGHQGATRVAQKVLDALRAAFRVGNSDQHVSGSIGIAVFPDDGRDPATLLRNADTAMFHGKSLGKNTYQFFTPQMNIAVKRRAALESNLRVAVQNGDFFLAYQPQIDLNTGQIVALEALVRWQSAESGTVMPGEFIALAEETGLISDIGHWVLNEACRQMVEWRSQGLPARRVAVNLSARQLAEKDFVESLEAVLNKFAIEPSLLELEITESQVMRQGEASVTLLDRIARLGVKLAVDDFGTGYSSLSYLK
ncbi:MAG TPA: PAS domain S-box protein, partial [Usitatibacteraceae bacterium]|nr:PAS domain S-box protein [Usitatibacteraceae bacterium]